MGGVLPLGVLDRSGCNHAGWRIGSHRESTTSREGPGTVAQNLYRVNALLAERYSCAHMA